MITMPMLAGGNVSITSVSLPFLLNELSSN